MKMDRELLENQIELKRAELINIALKYGLTSKNTIKYSQELDNLLNEYSPLPFYVQKKVAYN
ncbi:MULTISPECIES: aspartyl-phosphate phosphatase Spo0E family protein [Bacillaceae]|uniref:aspartyl-phosphate phosphatase Spo0E family protein n=1 Tax=Bacillaceae TaxID=186817 RepID=UPI000B28C668